MQCLWEAKQKWYFREAFLGRLSFIHDYESKAPKVEIFVIDLGFNPHGFPIFLYYLEQELR